MTIKATCTDCHSEHALGVREMGEVTTRCPSCGSHKYTSECTSDGKEDTEELRERLLDVPNVGEGVLDNIEKTLGSLSMLSTVSVEALTNIDHVGPTTAHNIKDAV